MTQQLVAPAIGIWGTEEQKARWLRPMLRTDELACQLFSETEAGSDLAGVRTKAVRDGENWVLTGHKVWTSGATVATWGVAVCRTDPDVRKHAGITVFLVRMDAPGVTVRPIRQMTGGASFNEVYLDGVAVPDTDRLGPVGEGWRVTLSVLAAERLDSGNLGLDNADRAVELAGHLPRPLTGAEQERAADLCVRALVQRLIGLRVTGALAAGREPGAEASVGKLYATETMRRTSDLVSELLGPSSSPTPGSGERTPGPSICWARPATASRAEPTRSSTTSSPSACSACPRSPSDEHVHPGDGAGPPGRRRAHRHPTRGVCR